MRIILIILDGLGDRPIPELRYNTPLEYAHTPNMDKLAKSGVLGQHIPISEGIPVGSGLGHLKLFGYSNYPGRGLLEAKGMNIDIKDNETAFRINFATCNSNLIVKDRRAGRNDYGMDKLVNELNKINGVRFYKGAQYRGVMIVKGDHVVKDIDPQMSGKKIPIENADDEIRRIFYEARKIMIKSKVNEERKKKGLLPANCILIRGASKYIEETPFQNKYGLKAVGVASLPLYLGVARHVGMDVVEMTDEEKMRILDEDYDFYFIHFKNTDSYGENGDYKSKYKYIEKIDKLLKFKDNDLVIITGDHSTPCEYKSHSGDPVPILISGPGVRIDSSKKFGERECQKGGLGKIKTENLMQIILDIAKKQKEVGK